MKLFIKYFFLALTVFSFSFCASKQNTQMDFPQEIAAVYFQKWIGGQEQSGSGTDFYIEFKKPLAKEIILEKIYFQNQEAKPESRDNQTFVAHFYQKTAQHDLILDSDPLKEYGNKAPVIVKPMFDLKPTEAVLEYKKNSKTFYFKIISIKEKPIIAYPSRNKPKN